MPVFQFGNYTITLIATDTVCDISDTSSVTIEHDQGVKPKARMDASYAGCDKNYEVQFQNYSKEANSYIWLFGDQSL
ncbi:MAG: hypothetical protein U5L96_04690 [Owenweeksia sp.]|nr:hypothetical protein [Owenweeksia sp.]